MTYTLHHGDCLEVMAGMEAGSVDAVVTDPPYGLEFMGKHWDHGLPGVDFWTEALTVLKPSSYLLAFGGTRTWHRLACALEDAGFEIRDTLMWLYGSGFPKGRACLKPAWEPVILARKHGPMRELGIEECRVEASADDVAVQRARTGGAMNASDGRSIYGPGSRLPAGNPSGRWPANVVLDEEAGRELDASTGTVRSAGEYRRGDVSCTGYGGWRTDGGPAYSDSGGPSRFFYCPKASRRERNAGLEGMEERVASVGNTEAAGRNPDNERNYIGGKQDRVAAGLSPTLPRQNHHPTVKPVDLMRWLVRLVARPGDVVLDPFTGSGTTGVACMNEGRDFIGIEREAEYVEISRRRIEAAAAQLRMDVTA